MRTKVLFRKEKDGQILAVFPQWAGDSNPYRTCLCYAHLGQHGAMAIDYLKDTTPATPDEYKPLYDELTSLGYTLKVYKRTSRKDLQERISQTR